MLVDAERKYWQRQNIKRSLQNQAVFLLKHNRVEKAEGNSFEVYDKVYCVTVQGGRLFCNCETFRCYRTCAHVIAVELVLRDRRVKP